VQPRYYCMGLIIQIQAVVHQLVEIDVGHGLKRSAATTGTATLTPAPPVAIRPASTPFPVPTAIRIPALALTVSAGGFPIATLSISAFSITSRAIAFTWRPAFPAPALLPVALLLLRLWLFRRSLRGSLGRFDLHYFDAVNIQLDLLGVRRNSLCRSCFHRRRGFMFAGYVSVQILIFLDVVHFINPFDDSGPAEP